MSASDAAPAVLHRCIRIGWVPQVVDENTSLRLQVAALTEQRDEALRVVATLEWAVRDARERVRWLEAAGPLLVRAAPPPSPLLVAWAALCALWFDCWAIFETDESAMGEARR